MDHAGFPTGFCDLKLRVSPRFGIRQPVELAHRDPKLEGQILWRIKNRNPAPRELSSEVYKKCAEPGTKIVVAIQKLFLKPRCILQRFACVLFIEAKLGLDPAVRAESCVGNDDFRERWIHFRRLLQEAHLTGQLILVHSIRPVSGSCEADFLEPGGPKAPRMTLL